MLGTPWLSGGGLDSWIWIGGGELADPLSENSFPFKSSGTVSNGGGDVANRGGCGDVALEVLGDFPTWLDDMTGLQGPTASGAMSTRNRDPGLEVPDPMEARSMADRSMPKFNQKVHTCRELPRLQPCLFVTLIFAVSVIDIDIVVRENSLLIFSPPSSFSHYFFLSIFVSSPFPLFSSLNGSFVHFHLLVEVRFVFSLLGWRTRKTQG